MVATGRRTPQVTGGDRGGQHEATIGSLVTILSTVLQGAQWCVYL